MTPASALYAYIQYIYVPFLNLRSFLNLTAVGYATVAGDMVGTIFNVVTHVGPTLVRAVHDIR